MTTFRRPHRLAAAVVLLGTCFSSTLGCASSSPAASPTSTAAAASTAQIDQLVQLTVDQARQSGFTVDAACVRRLASRLTAADAAILVANAGSTDVSVSPAGEALGVQLTNCILVAPSSTARP